MPFITDILDAVYSLLVNPINVEVLALQYTAAIRNMVVLNGINLNLNYLNFSGEVFGGIVKLSRTVVLPIGYAVLAYLMVLEIYTLYSKSEGMGGEGAIHMPLKIVIKIVLFKFIIDRTHDLLDAIYRLILYIQNQTFSYTIEYTIPDNAVKHFVDHANSLDFLGKIMLFIEVNAYTLISTLSLVIIMIVAVARIFEIYIYLFIAPIPLATLPGGELSHIGKNFLKSFTAICMQGVILAIILFLYAQFASVFVVGSTLKDHFWKGITGVILLTFCLFRSGKWARSICGAM
ncbi:MAG: hypothetical protein FWG21_00445 [Oscillospiraceae bacterium]|nr:hypothetical protein [Oscillospiraceae bacterium]